MWQESAILLVCSSLPDQRDKCWLQRALDTFRGASKVAWQSFSVVLKLLRNVNDTRAVVPAIIAFLVATVAAAAAPGTNAERMARGLPPKAPRKLYRKDPTPVSRAYHADLILSTRLAFSSFLRG